MTQEVTCRCNSDSHDHSEVDHGTRPVGKWAQTGVPHAGWEWLGCEDLGEFGAAICEMCEQQKLRYVHTMQHPNFRAILHTGCECAKMMVLPYAAKAKLLEAEEGRLKGQAGRARKSAAKLAQVQAVTAAAMKEPVTQRFQRFFALRVSGGTWPDLTGEGHWAVPEPKTVPTDNLAQWRAQASHAKFGQVEVFHHDWIVTLMKKLFLRIEKSEGIDFDVLQAHAEELQSFVPGQRG